MRRVRQWRYGRFVAGLVAAALLAAACGNAKKTTATTTKPSGSTAPTSAADLNKFVHLDEPGVTDSEIRIAAITSRKTIVGDYAPLVDGMKAYFAMVNDAGGIYKRKLTIVSDRDDQSVQNLREVQASLAQDNAFATFVATLVFSGADALEQAGQPTFIWNINPEMAGHPHIFGNVGAICFSCPGHAVPWLAKKLGVKRVAVLAYGGSEQSKKCAAGDKAAFAKFPTAEIVVFDNAVPLLSPDLSSQVTEMKRKKVQMVTTCMDRDETFVLAKEMKKQGLDAIQELPNGYDQAFIAANKDYFEGDIVNVQFTAFEHRPQIPEIKQLIKWHGKIGKKVVETSAVGWIIAAELVEGLKLAGPEFSKQKVVDALNSQTAMTVNGMIEPIDWTTAHIDPETHPEARGELECANSVKVHDGKFVPMWTEPGKPWICIKRSDPTVDTAYNTSFAPSATG